LLRATCHFRGLRISWFIVGILTDLFKQNSRPAPFLRWSGGACSQFLNAPPRRNAEPRTGPDCV
jgi:hypothetical protein